MQTLLYALAKLLGSPVRMLCQYKGFVMVSMAIVGAGIAGLTLAQHYSQCGYRVQVYEKSRGLGGRLSTRRQPWGDLDIGAQYFTARDARFIEQVLRWQHAGVVAPWLFTPYRVHNDVLVLSPDKQQRYVGTPAMNSMVHALAENITIMRQHTITRVHHHDGHWSLFDDQEHMLGQHDVLILALPAEQAKALLSQNHSPPYAIAQTIPDHVHEPCWALALSTTGDVPYDDSDQPIQGVFGDHVVSWLSRLNMRPQRGNTVDAMTNTWMLHFSSTWSQKYSTCDREYARQMLVKTGEQWCHTHLSDALKCVQYDTHFWRYARVAPHVAAGGPLVDEMQKLAVIGDWCMGGRVEGAYLSALELIEKNIF